MHAHRRVGAHLATRELLKDGDLCVNRLLGAGHLRVNLVVDSFLDTVQLGGERGRRVLQRIGVLLRDEARATLMGNDVSGHARCNVVVRDSCCAVR